MRPELTGRGKAFAIKGDVWRSGRRGLNCHAGIIPRAQGRPKRDVGAAGSGGRLGALECQEHGSASNHTRQVSAVLGTRVDVTLDINPLRG